MGGHLGIPFGALHKARLKSGAAADIDTLPEGVGDIYYASDTETLYLAQIRDESFSNGFSNGFQTGSRWRSFILPDVGIVTELSDLEDVASADQTANLVMATPSGVSGDYAGRALTSGWLPDLDANKISGIVAQDIQGTGIGQYSTGDILVGNTSDILVRVPTGTPRQLLTVNTAANPKVGWATGSLVGTALKGARVYNSGTQTVNNATETTLAWNAESFDTDGCHDNSSNNERLICQTAGYYLVMAHLNVTTVFTTDILNITLTVYLNGTATIKGRTVGGLFVSTLLAMSVSDYVLVRLLQSRGASVTVASGESCSFMMVRIAPP